MELRTILLGRIHHCMSRRHAAVWKALLLVYFCSRECRIRAQSVLNKLRLAPSGTVLRLAASASSHLEWGAKGHELNDHHLGVFGIKTSRAEQLGRSRRCEPPAFETPCLPESGRHG